MGRMFEHERKAFADLFMQKVDHYTTGQLRALMVSMNREMANARLPFPDDVQLNYLILARVKQRVEEAEQQATPLTPEEHVSQEAHRLAREHGVTEKTARGFLERAMRKDIRPAPDPETAERRLTPRERYDEKWGRR